MGIYLDPGTKGFEESLNSEIYVDRSGLIAKVNAMVNSRQKYICVSRPRRFGKSMAMDMLSAYYSYGRDSRALFEGSAILSDPSFEKHLNAYFVIKINLPHFLGMVHGINEMLELLQSEILGELQENFATRKQKLFLAMEDVYARTGRPFVILIDEWDCLFREYKEDGASQEKYLDFLRSWLKDRDYVALAYMTGILPVKKYGTHSALNMFTESSMTDAGELAPYFGFTEDEVKELCRKYRMDFDEARAWYDGYELTCGFPDGEVNYSLYNPKSVVESMMRHRYGTYWNRTETYEALKAYIRMNMDGLKDAVVSMLAGESVPINKDTFSNDMTTFACKDDVLTLLIHLGYLSYHVDEACVSIPNKEVAQEYINAIRTMDWHEVTRSIEASRKLLEELWDGDADAVAAGIDRAHEEISILKYNDENSLACAIGLAFYYAREYYQMVREMPAGRGFADICFIPHPYHADKPAVVIELKYNATACGALQQIKDKKYPDALKDYKGRLILAGINYDKETKKHACAIERQTL